MLPNDFLEFEKFLQLEDDVRFLERRLSTPDVQTYAKPISHISSLEKYTPYLFLVRVTDLEKIKVKYITAQNYWVIEEANSMGVEYIRPFFDGRTVRRGRLYCPTSFYDNNYLVKMPEEYLRWAKRLIDWIHRYCSKEQHSFFYISPRVSKLVSEKSITLNRL